MLTGYYLIGISRLTAMAASGSGKGVSVGIDGKDAMDKTMEGMSLSEAGDLVDKGKGRVEGDVLYTKKNFTENLLV